MTRITTALVAAFVATMLSAPLRAETAAPPTAPAATPAPAAEPSTTDKIKTMSKEQWSKMRAEWAKDKDKYKTCRDAAKGLKFKARWASIYDCMTK